MKVFKSLINWSVILTTIVIVFLLTYWFTQVIPPTIPITRHVDLRAEAERIPLPNYMTLLTMNIFDSIVQSNYTAVNEGLKTLLITYIPDKYKFIVERFTQLLNQVSKLLEDSEELLNNAEELINLGRGRDAELLLSQVSTKLAYANITYIELRSASEELAKTFRLSLSEVRRGVEGVGVAIDRLYLRLIKLLEVIKGQEVLKDSFLDIDVSPKNVWTGGRVLVSGRLYTVDGGLVGRVIHIHVDGVKVAEAITSLNGLFEVYVNLPYTYKSRIYIQARYIPQDVDRQTYKLSASNIVEVSLLYIEPEIVIEDIGEVLPGKTFVVRGLVRAEGILPYSSIRISWLNTSLIVSLNDSKFYVVLYTPKDVVEGKYPLVVRTPPQGIYAPAEKVTYVSVRRLQTNAFIYVPQLIIAGYSLTLRGEISYAGEQCDATVKAVFTDQTYVVNATRDFSVSIVAPLTTLTGYYSIKVYITPTLPWYKDVVIEKEVLVINPITVMFPFGLLSVLASKFLRSRGKELGIAEEVVEGGVRPMIKERYFTQVGLEELVDMYWQAVVIVSKLSGVVMEPSMTMREYLEFVKPRLDDSIKTHFEVLTNIAEKALYARGVSDKEFKTARMIFEEIRIAAVKA